MRRSRRLHSQGIFGRFNRQLSKKGKSSAKGMCVVLQDKREPLETCAEHLRLRHAHRPSPRPRVAQNGLGWVAVVWASRGRLDSHWSARPGLSCARRWCQERRPRQEGATPLRGARGELALGRTHPAIFFARPFHRPRASDSRAQAGSSVVVPASNAAAPAVAAAGTHRPAHRLTACAQSPDTTLVLAPVRAVLWTPQSPA